MSSPFNTYFPPKIPLQIQNTMHSNEVEKKEKPETGIFDSFKTSYMKHLPPLLNNPLEGQELTNTQTLKNKAIAAFYIGMPPFVAVLAIVNAFQEAVKNYNDQKMEAKAEKKAKVDTAYVNAKASINSMKTILNTHIKTLQNKNINVKDKDVRMVLNHEIIDYMSALNKLVKKEKYLENHINKSISMEKNLKKAEDILTHDEKIEKIETKKQSLIEERDSLVQNSAQNIFKHRELNSEIHTLNADQFILQQEKANLLKRSPLGSSKGRPGL
ncbi:MAG TPA: hypothetical protein VGP47_11805 [Parachlamydiaceae bacterium]|nr:hypothetical protein [Parachlamydiaceae bacterium]